MLQTLAPLVAMYRNSIPGQLTFENFYLPFGGKLSSHNRWVKLAEIVPWEQFEAEYAAQMSADVGAPAKPFRMALGALIIKERLGTSDEETVEQIRENPYLQYFLGLSEYSEQAPFESSMMVHFRKRLKLEFVGRINEAIVKQSQVPPLNGAEAPSLEARKDDDDDDGDEPPPPQGQLILDASCAPADIRYPTDLSLLNEAREKTEAIIDALYEQVREQLAQKPRTYRQAARKEYLKVAKQRQTNRRVKRKAVGKQLGYVSRNLNHIDALIRLGASLSQLSKYLYRQLLIISELFRQQQWMYQQRQHRIDDRIVSLSQPQVRPIVRGKAGTPVEFGAKFSASCVKGQVLIDHLDWNNFNESGDLPQQVEQFRSRLGHYPESVHADQIYRTRANREYCRVRGIRLSGKPLGRPVVSGQSELRQQERADARVRNQIEGKFGQGKRRFSLARVMAKLATTAETTIAITFLVMNLESLLRQLLFILWGILTSRWHGRSQNGQRQLFEPRELLRCAFCSM
jgi:transposase, IS5 family